MLYKISLLLSLMIFANVNAMDVQNEQRTTGATAGAATAAEMPSRERRSRNTTAHEVPRLSDKAAWGILFGSVIGFVLLNVLYHYYYEICFVPGCSWDKERAAEAEALRGGPDRFIRAAMYLYHRARTVCPLPEEVLRYCHAYDDPNSSSCKSGLFTNALFKTEWQKKYC